MQSRFRDRAEAGRQLALQLLDYAGHPDVLVLGLPRGGVPVAFQVAKKLRAPLDVFVVRKLGVPGHRELAMGAIASGGIRVINSSVVRELGITEDVIDEVAAEEQPELHRREIAYRGLKEFQRLAGKTVILADDGIATGSTMKAAIAAIQQEKPARLIVAVPTVSPQACAEIEPMVDKLVALIVPQEFYAVGQFYDDFSQTTDAEVSMLLSEALSRSKGTPGKVLPAPALL